MLIYKTIQEVGGFIDIRRNQRHLVEQEKQWMFEQRNLWDVERVLKYNINGIINHGSIKHSPMGRNTISRSPLVDWEIENKSFKRKNREV
jgi:hypothetical protein